MDSFSAYLILKASLIKLYAMVMDMVSSVNCIINQFLEKNIIRLF